MEVHGNDLRYRTRSAIFLGIASPMNNHNSLAQEWQTLQGSHEQHERNALLIKLTGLALCVAGLAAHVPLGWLAVAVVLLWGQEGIIKTYQSRLADRLLVVESLLRDEKPARHAMQLHTDWVKNRPGSAGLIASYAMSACRPTVAFPYLPILITGCIPKFI